MEKESYTGFDAALDEEQQMKEGKYKKAEKYYDSIFEGIETESLPLPDCSGKTPERGYLSMPVDTGESLVLSACEKLGVTPNILFTGVFGILPIPRRVFLQLFIMEEMIPDWRIQSACL